MTLRHRFYITEATFNINKDVDFIYKSAKLDRFDKLQKRSQDDIISIFNGVYPGESILYIASEDLPGKDTNKAHRVNPVKIYIGIYDSGSYYKPEGKLIKISLNFDVVSIIKERINTESIGEISRSFGKKGESFLKTLDSNNVKGTIAHELSHWIDDSLHNEHIKKKIKTAREMGNSKSMTGGYSSVDQHYMEIEAQIHAIKSIKKDIGAKEFNKMSWRDLFLSKESLMSQFTFRYIYNLPKKEYEDTMKRVVKRLDREGLLGKGLCNFPTYSEMTDIMSSLGRF